MAMMDGELSHRLAWYFTYYSAAEGVMSSDHERKLILAAEEAGSFNNLPAEIKAEIMEAELDYSKEEYPLLTQPWPLRAK